MSLPYTPVASAVCFKISSSRSMIGIIKNKGTPFFLPQIDTLYLYEGSTHNNLQLRQQFAKGVSNSMIYINHLFLVIQRYTRVKLSKWLKIQVHKKNLILKIK